MFIVVTVILSLVHIYVKHIGMCTLNMHLNVCYSTFNKVAEISMKLGNFNVSWSHSTQRFNTTTNGTGNKTSNDT